MAIVVECYADEKLVLTLLPQKRGGIRHSGGKGNIFNYLKKEQTMQGIGLIDEDPRSTQPKEFIHNYDLYDSHGSVKLYRHKRKPECSVVMLSPRLEEWIISRARAVKIDPGKYNLPDDGKKLHSIPRYDKGINFEGFLSALQSSSDSEVEKIREWLGK